MPVEEIRQRAINYDAGAAGDAILAQVSATDVALVAAWEGKAGGEPGGNCFFATVQMLHNLIVTGQAEGYTMVTGRFDHFDTPEPVFHSWLEKGGVVLNVSNLRVRPLYVMPRPAYYRINALGTRVQRIAPARVARMVRECGGDVRAATKRLVKPTFSRMQKGE